jgi:flagellar hook assembly protein FlgD
LQKTQDFVPGTFSLYQNYPNPFNPVTQITYDIPEDSYIALRIYDLSGAYITSLMDEISQKGKYTVKWDGTDANGKDVSSGVYFYRFDSNLISMTKKMLLIR